MRTTQIELKYPVTVNGHEYKVITMRAPKVRDQIIAQKAAGKEEMELTLFSNLCEISTAVLEELEIADYNQFHTAYQDFLS
ncbi:phage tail assembly protein [Halodesulfovibrio marinisediminis]|uniref:Phage tail assembly chaperone protein, E, or 41 or 14 n=1 Tax=Halodesulfovibrio marinisediminis DSM 17456 TaxID=1121457 RepID=A0A1N6I0V2_9BACT|nr:phage tail assembly protein [Halodesulfovibrio marinisediminis]SIO25660.1 Phage tail assembly chaperone protein, E, or 41 or 14 [Halodesulfovibrio marinisediminis DSM 17456]